MKGDMNVAALDSLDLDSLDLALDLGHQVASRALWYRYPKEPHWVLGAPPALGSLSYFIVTDETFWDHGTSTCMTHLGGPWVIFYFRAPS